MVKIDVLQYEEVKEWIDAVTEKFWTRHGYLRAMGRFIEFTGWTPKEMLEIKASGLKEGKIKTELESKIVEFIRTMQREGKQRGEGKYAPGSVIQFRTAIGSFLSYHGFQLPRKFMKLGKALLKRMRDPELNEVEAMIQYATNLQVKALLTVAAECPCRSRVFEALQWDWLEEGWENKDIVHIQLPTRFRPLESGPKKFEPIAFIGPRSISILKQLAEKRGRKGRVFPYSRHWFVEMPEKVYARAVREHAVRPSAADEQPITFKSFRKYVFNAIDACRDISPEWRSMLKGRDLGVEKYYSKENVEKLREVYRNTVYPEIWREKPSLDEQQLRLDMARKILTAAGIDADQVLRSMPHLTTVDEQMELLDKEIKKLGLSRRRTEANGGKLFESRIISEEELIGFLDEGWDLVKELSNGRIVIRKALGD